jgi:Ca2+-binding EF-hand superfamily protein
MFKIFDKTRQGYLTHIQFIQLLNKFDIHLNEEDLYHITAEIDKNQDGVISYNELYYALITDTLQI